MLKGRHLFTSESVTEGHPDKICDQISDAILDAILEKDPNARVACETSVTTGLVLVTGKFPPIHMWIFRKWCARPLKRSAIRARNTGLMRKHALC